MTNEPPAQPGISRRQLLQGAALAVGAVGLLGGASSHLVSSAQSKLQVRDGDEGVQITYGGRRLVVLQGVHLSAGNDARFVGVDVADSTRRLTVQAPGSGDVTVELTLHEHSVTLDMTIDVPAKVDPVQFQLQRTLSGGGDGLRPLTRWARDARGGVPFQEPLGYGQRFDAGDVEAFEIMSGCHRPSEGQAGVGIPFGQSDDGRYHLRYVLSVAAAGGDPALAAALEQGGAAIRARTDQPFACVRGGSRRARVELLTAATGLGDSGTLTWVLRDFDGKVVMHEESDIGLDAPQTTRLRTPELTRGVYIGDAELHVEDAVVARSRLLVSVLDATPVSPGSIFGLAALDADQVLPGVDRAAWVALVGWLGFAHLRKPDLTPAEAASIGVQLFGHHQTTVDTGEDRGTTLDAFAREVQEQQVVREELGNELDRSKEISARDYVEQWLVPFTQRVSAFAPALPVTSQGLGSVDLAWLDEFVAAGGWEHVDAIGLHAGRGNVTADQTDGEWTFLGTVRAARAWMAGTAAARGTRRALRITEAYACTQPNRWWSDTLRTAAENLLLQAALAISEGAAQVSWYQLSDGVWYDWQNADPDEAERHYGLLTIDGELKPSALAAATVNEHLAGVTFTGATQLPGKSARGLTFDRFGTRLDVLWSRADGYELNRDHRKGSWFASPEPWEDVWPTKVTVTLPTAAKEITVVDCIGRRTTIEPEGGKVTLRLDGAPRIVYGLS